MTARRALVGVIAALTLALAACGSTSSTDAPVTPPTTPDGVAGAFSAAFAAGDTPTACQYTSGRAKERMTEGGSVSLCSHSAWAAQDYWLSDQCEITGTHGVEFTYIYRASGMVGGGDSFVASVTGAGPFYSVTAYVSGPFSKTGGICATADRLQSTSPGVPS